MYLPSPYDITTSFSPSDLDKLFLIESQKTAKEIILGVSDKKALLVGPCSIHNEEETLEYASRLKRLSNQLQNFFVVMRFFIEKPRSKKGWKGLLYDPGLQGKSDLAKGITLSRKILLNLTKIQVPCAIELLDPLAFPYMEDLTTWAMIGARTSASQPHRQLASGLNIPVGFKNGIDGDLDIAIQGILSSHDPHTHLAVDLSGRLIQKTTNGNPLSHLTLRGSSNATNFDPLSVQMAINALEKEGLKPKVLIDCSHGNSNRDHALQKIAFKSSIDQMAKGNTAIIGVMLESNLNEGKQSIQKTPLDYGVSITDACIGWDETYELVLSADDLLSRSMSSVQR